MAATDINPNLAGYAPTSTVSSALPDLSKFTSGASLESSLGDLSKFTSGASVEGKLGDLTKFTPNASVAGGMADLSKYMNPQTDNILSAALRNLGDQGQKRRNQLGTEAFSAGAYGDARHGVESAMLDKELATAAGDLTADVTSSMFDRAMSLLSSDVDRTNANFNAGMGWLSNDVDRGMTDFYRGLDVLGSDVDRGMTDFYSGLGFLGSDVDRTNANFTTGMGFLGNDLDRSINAEFQNAQLDNQWFTNQLNAMGMGNSIWQGALDNGMSYADSLLGLDQYDRGIEQDQLNTQYDEWQTKRNWDAEKLAQFLGFVQGTPSESTSTTSSPSNSWASLLGAALGNIDIGGGASLFGG